jgi:hypothetical protein
MPLVGWAHSDYWAGPGVPVSPVEPGGGEVTLFDLVGSGVA